MRVALLVLNIIGFVLSIPATLCVASCSTLVTGLAAGLAQETGKAAAGGVAGFFGSMTLVMLGLCIGSFIFGIIAYAKPRTGAAILGGILLLLAGLMQLSLIMVGGVLGILSGICLILAGSFAFAAKPPVKVSVQTSGAVTSAGAAPAKPVPQVPPAPPKEPVVAGVAGNAIAQSGKKQTKLILIIVIAVVGAAGIGIGATFLIRSMQETSAYKEAVQKGDSRIYLSKYPGGRYRVAMLSFQDSLDFAKAKKQGDAAGYADYLSKNEKGTYVQEAKASLSALEEAQYAQLAASTDVNKLQEFLRTFPSSQYRGAVLNQIRRAAGSSGMARGSASAYSGTGSYLLPATSQRIISDNDLQRFSKKDVQLIRNEIYARHGRPFVTPWIREYFQSKPWYRVNPRFSDNLLSDIEKTNVQVIVAYEKKMGYN
jgi:hypothetical protein